MPNHQGGDLPRAWIKTKPEDWQVVEQYAAEFSGQGEHAYLYVEKRGLSTPPVAQWLSDRLEVPLLDVGYAGMKDKHAVTRQWFSVRLPGNHPLPLAQDLNLDRGDEQITVLASHQHHRKLRRGEHQANGFTIVLREVTPDLDCRELQARIQAGFPNYFGPQRFGRCNLADAMTWLAQRRRRKISRRARGWHLSVLRSWVFNRLLASRVEDGTWQTVLQGDLTSAVGKDEVLVATGPLWGRGREPLSGEALQWQQRAMAEDASGMPMTLGEVCEALEYAGVDRGQRPLSVTPWDVECSQTGTTVTVSFCLPVGAYATVMLNNHFDLQDKSVESVNE
jgi:tRNA pseudouridine13 synthase